MAKKKVEEAVVVLEVPTEVHIETLKVAPLGQLATNDVFITALQAKLDEVIAHLNK